MLVGAILFGTVGAVASGETPPTTTTPVAVQHPTRAEIAKWMAAIERAKRDSMLHRLGALKRGITDLPGDTLDYYLPELRRLAIQVDRRGITSVVIARVQHIEARYHAEVRRVWANIAALAAWHRAHQAYPHGLCGGDLPPCYVMWRESRGDITAQNPHSTASGKWQFLDSTWAGYGGYAKARYAPEKVQDDKARLLWAGGRGCSHWSAC